MTAAFAPTGSPLAPLRTSLAALLLAALLVVTAAAWAAIGTGGAGAAGCSPSITPSSSAVLSAMHAAPNDAPGCTR